MTYVVYWSSWDNRRLASSHIHVVRPLGSHDIPAYPHGQASHELLPLLTAEALNSSASRP